MKLFKKKIERILLINPSYTFNTYIDIDRYAGTLQHPLISLASLAGAVKNICDIKILDLDVEENQDLNQIIDTAVHSYNPDVVGITATTPTFPVLIKIAEIIKKINREIIVVSGGVHTTACPQEAISSNFIDIAVVGEADFFFKDLAEKAIENIEGIYYKDNSGRIIFNERKTVIADLDTLPMPAWELYDLSKYKSSKLIEKFAPGGLLETSRGCPFLCNYCNKKIFGTRWRAKSVGRVVEEFRVMKKFGFKEIHIEDDGFSTDINRAKKICQELIEQKIDIPWTLLNGIRADRTDRELFELLKKSGCYQVAFGIESGDESVLRRINKGITLNQIKNAVCLASEAGLETFGFFMLGLLGEDEQSLKKTVDFASNIPLTIAKFAIAIPYPGTRMFEELDSQGLILHKNWANYLVHNNRMPVFQHPQLEWGVIRKYYKKAYRSFYFRPRLFFKQLWLSINDGSLGDKINYFIKTKWW